MVQRNALEHFHNQRSDPSTTGVYRRQHLHLDHFFCLSAGVWNLWGGAGVGINQPSERLITSRKNQSRLLTGLHSETAPAPLGFGIIRKNTRINQGKRQLRPRFWSRVQMEFHGHIIRDQLSFWILMSFYARRCNSRTNRATSQPLRDMIYLSDLQQAAGLVSEYPHCSLSVALQKDAVSVKEIEITTRSEPQTARVGYICKISVIHQKSTACQCTRCLFLMPNSSVHAYTHKCMLHAERLKRHSLKLRSSYTWRLLLRGVQTVWCWKSFSISAKSNSFQMFQTPLSKMTPIAFQWNSLICTSLHSKSKIQIREALKDTQIYCPKSEHLH